MLAEYPEDNPTTLDISDSTFTLNKYSLLGFANELYLFDSAKQNPSWRCIYFNKRHSHLCQTPYVETNG